MEVDRLFTETITVYFIQYSDNSEQLLLKYSSNSYFSFSRITLHVYLFSKHVYLVFYVYSISLNLSRMLQTCRFGF